MSDAPIAGLWSRGSVRAAALAVSTFAVYAASLGGGFLNYDDPWLIVDNPWLEVPPLEALGAFFFDLSRDTRLALGAEYLPLRDLSVWLDVQLFGKHAPALRTTQLLLYVAAVLAFRAGFVACFGAARGELLAWLFALHPLHIESVAWLAGRKDVVALACLGAALWRHARGGRDARVSVPLLWLGACLAKSMAVGFVGPLLATDLWLRRRPDPVRYAAGGLAVALATAVHLYVGSLVQMVSGPLAGSRWDALWTMGPVWLRYLAMVVDPRLLSVRHDVAVLHGPTLLSLAGWAVLLGSGLYAAARALRHDSRLPLTAWLWFAVPLAPVSQVLVPLQNLLADRYLWLCVAGPLLLLAHLDLRVRPALARPLAYVLLVTLAGSTALRAPLFSDSVWLFAEATDKTQHDPDAPYQLGKALEARGDAKRAIAAYAEAVARAPEDDPTLAKATNNLARLLVREGQLDQARAALERALTHQPHNPKLRRNLAKVMAKQRVRESGTDGAQLRTP